MPCCLSAQIAAFSFGELEIKTPEALSYFGCRGAGLGVDTRQLAEVTDLLQMKHAGTAAMPARSEVSAGTKWDESAGNFTVAIGKINMFLALKPEDASLARTLALAFTEGPFALVDER